MLNRLLRHPILLLAPALPLLLAACSNLAPSPYAHLGKSAPSVRSSDFQQRLTTITKSPWRSANHTDTLADGQAFLPAMRKAVLSAKKSITFESYVFVQSNASYQFCRALAQKAREGIPVKVVLDAVGSRGIGELCERTLRDAGVDLHLFHPFSIVRPLRSNHRNHKRFLIIDGQTAFTGGAGHAHAWAANSPNSPQWRDTMYRVRGPIVADLQDAFDVTWEKVTKQSLRTHPTFSAFYPALSSQGNQIIQLNHGFPSKHGDTIGASYLLAIDAAKDEILIEHAYFVPPKPLLRALIRARQRGVKIKIILSGKHIDTPLVEEGSKPTWRPLLAAGAKLYKYQKSNLHGKLMIVDKQLSIIGSANFDPRSFHINNEANLHVLSSSFAQSQRAMFANDLKHCEPIQASDADLKLGNLPLRIATKILSSQI